MNMPQFKKSELEFYESLINFPAPSMVIFLKKLLGIKRIYAETKFGQILFIDPVSHLGLEILRNQIYEPVMSKLFQILLRPHDNCIDIGAQEGYFSILASLYVVDGQVHYIEPQKNLNRVIDENILINRVFSITKHQIALSDSEQNEVKLFVSNPIFGGCVTMIKKPGFHYFRQKTSTTTLDIFLRKIRLKKVRLIKIDTEGYEHKIIRGAKEILKQHIVDCFAIEYHPDIISAREIIDTHAILKENGYILSKHEGHTIYHIPGLENELAQLGDLEVDALV
jgi:FkbM family methyltransferase